jgi:hypothetical protein
MEVKQNNEIENIPQLLDFLEFIDHTRCLILYKLLHTLFIRNTSIKGKAVPLQAWSGPEGSRKLRFPDFVTTAQDGGKVVSLTHRPPSFLLEAESTPGP